MFSLARTAETMTATIRSRPLRRRSSGPTPRASAPCSLSDFLAACRSRLRAVVLAEDQRLVGVKRARACGAEDRGGGLNAVAFGRYRQGEFVALLFAAGQIRQNQVGG